MHIKSHYSHIALIFLTIFSIVFAFTVYAKEYGISERSIVIDGGGSFSDTQIYDFTVSGGDVIGASMHLESYVSVEWLYTGGGSIFVYFDGDEGSGETFILPDNGDVGYMQFVLEDKLKKLESVDAGIFNHQLYVKPTGVTINSISAHVSSSYARDTSGKCEDGDPATEKVKTVQYLVANADEIITEQQYTINFGLNDDLIGITNPISSAYVEVVGLYTGGGTIEIYFNDKLSDGVVHDLQNTNKYRQLSIISKDINDLITGQGGEDFSQIVNINPIGVTLSGVSIKFILTYKYHPMKSGCSGFPIKGEYTSVPLDTNTNRGVEYNSIAWDGELGGDNKDVGRVRFQLATAPCSNGATNYPACNIGSWSFVGGSSCNSVDWFESIGPKIPIDLFKTGCSDKLNNNQYYKYKVQICSKDCIEAGQSTPTIEGIYVSWSP